MAHGRDAGRRAALTARSSNQSGFVALGNMGGPGLAGFRVDVGEARARRWIGNADEMVASGALNLPARVAGIAFQGLVAVGSVEFEFVRAHGLRPHHAQIGREKYIEL